MAKGQQFCSKVPENLPTWVGAHNPPEINRNPAPDPRVPFLLFLWLRKAPQAAKMIPRDAKMEAPNMTGNLGGSGDQLQYIFFLFDS